MSVDCKDCGRPDPAAKPPPIRIGVKGFDAWAASSSKPLMPITPSALANLPAFQMFAAERGVLPAMGARATDVVAEYMEWHRQKGQWPLEDPWGRLQESK